MRQQGRLTEWNDDRGFGFITPLDGGPRVFVHISQFPRDKRRPMRLDLVAYDVDKDERGRLRGTQVLYVTLTGSARPSPRRTSTGERQFPVTLTASVLLVGMFIAASFYFGPSFVGKNHSYLSASSSTDQSIESAFQNHASGVQVVGEGVVERVLSDDNNGSRHQRFILRLASGQTLLIAHNIDLAPRLGSLASGDKVEFNGVYEWNEKGGVIHWTHRDPNGQHATGWLQHNGMIYQ
jgi:cold shock CspA family protein